MEWLQAELPRGGEVHLRICSVCFILDNGGVAKIAGIVESGIQESGLGLRDTFGNGFYAGRLKAIGWNSIAQ